MVSEEEDMNMGYRVGAGLQINEWFGLEALWDSTGVEPRRLIQKANLPMTILPLQIDIRSHEDRYLTASTVLNFHVLGQMSFIGKVGIAQHWSKIEFEVSTSNSIIGESFEVDENNTTPMISYGIEFFRNSRAPVSLEFLSTYFFEKDNDTFLFTTSVKMEF